MLVINVPVVGRVTLVAPVVVRVRAFVPDVEKASAKETFLLAVRVSDSSPPKVIEFVLRVVESLTVRVLLSTPASVRELLAVNVLPAPRVKVPEPVEMIFPLNWAASTL